MSRLLWFFGAGASAPFGLPTMQDMVEEFHKELKRDGSDDEKALFGTIVRFLKNTLDRPVDLEAVLTVTDSILNWSPDKVSMPTLFAASRKMNEVSVNDLDYIEPLEIGKVYGKKITEVGRSLKGRFEDYVKRACGISQDQHRRIEEYYGALFSIVAETQKSKLLDSIYGCSKNGAKYCRWPIFTTNYDLILETYWKVLAGTPIHCGFQADGSWHPNLLRTDDLRLCKLHGSLNWWQFPDGEIKELPVLPHNGMTADGRELRGQVMLYPIEEKQLYLEPYVTFYEMLGRELKSSAIWVVVGYSFGDQVISSIFSHQSTESTELIIVDPNARVLKDRLHEFNGSIEIVSGRFAKGDARTIPDEIGLLLPQL